MPVAGWTGKGLVRQSAPGFGIASTLELTLKLVCLLGVRVWRSGYIC